MGVITLEDIMESILQGRVYDEWDMKGSLENRNEMRCDFEFNSNLDAHKTFCAGAIFKDRDRAIGTLQRWAAVKLQNFVRRRRKSGTMKGESGHKSPTNYYTTTLSPIKEIIIHRMMSTGDETTHSNTDSNQKDDNDGYHSSGHDGDHDIKFIDTPNLFPTSTTPLLQSGTTGYNQYT
jgi:hypothetical protein